jgi:hypothetical protein
VLGLFNLRHVSSQENRLTPILTGGVQTLYDTSHSMPFGSSFAQVIVFSWVACTSKFKRAVERQV